jgi:cytochrome c oxidase assembly factor CtaG
LYPFSADIVVFRDQPMDSTLDAFVRSWPFEPWLSAALSLSAGTYLRGWFILYHRDVDRWLPWQIAAFLGGLTAIFLALASPIEPFASLLLTMVAPPLLWLGAPFIPMLRGLPAPVRTYWVAPLIGSRAVRWCFHRLAHPFLALPLFVAATWLWHVPRFYEVALRSPGWHYVQHLCFLVTALLFWYPVIRPYPCRPRWSLWLLFPYLILADVQNTVLSALLTFSERVLYAPYAEAPRLGELSALDDQSAAGVLMWVPGSLVYLTPLFWIGIRLLSGAAARPRPARSAVAASHVLPIVAAGILAPGRSARSGKRARFDLVRLPILGRFLRWKHARLAVQLPLGAMAGLLIWDGWHGPQIAPMNLAGVLPWIHWRGVVILGLLVAGNITCLACPFTLPRTLARRWLPAGLEWPRWLRTKWLAVILLALFFWAYEAFALWNSPRWTAWIALGYFIAAFVIDGFFREGSFCKYVCPIGQFNFVQSLVSPFEVGVHDPDLCATCRTHDCIRGRGQTPGCAMDLFQPRKSSNMDCTFCLDCVHACPHQNVGIMAVVPGKDLWSDPVRSGVGRFGKRADLAVLVLVLVFGAFLNAAGMAGPVVEWQERMRTVLGNCSALMVTSLYYLLGLGILPCLVIASVAVVSGWWGRLGGSWFEVATCFSYSLVPLGFGMWLAHYSFHFLGSYETAVPVMHRFLEELGVSLASPPAWALACCRPVADWLPRLEIFCLDCGLLLSLYTGHRIALNVSAGRWRALNAFLPWAALIVVLFAAGVWIILQPMQMRGTMPGM